MLKKLEKIKKSGYSDKQHRKNKGEGQFHINNKTLQHHLDEYFEKEITFEDLYKMFK